MDSPAGYDPSFTIAASPPGGPAWEIALLYPPQGSWSEADYLELGSNHMIEFTDGCVEVLPMPTIFHQLLVEYIHSIMKAYIALHQGGRVFFAPIPVRLWPAKYREPDLIYLRRERLQGNQEYPDGADLVVEVVGEGEVNRRRDLETKRSEYAAAGIAEYWIVDPQTRSITVLVLENATYRVHGEFRGESAATSVLLPGLSVPVSAMFVAAENP